MNHLNRTIRHIIIALLLSVSGSTLVSADELNQAELDQMLAPIALYPDSVLTHIFIAAGYPLEVVQAARLSAQHSQLKGEAAVQLAADKDWDPSVKALLAFPQLLQQMSNELEWTQQLGEAFLQEESQVLASVQNLRQKAYQQGALTQMQHMAVQQHDNIIIIEPAQHNVIYLPYYDSRTIYGNWWWPSAPPVYWYSGSASHQQHPFQWGVSINVMPSFYFGMFDWHQHRTMVNLHFYHQPPRHYPKRHHFERGAKHWQHDYKHRRGMQYRHHSLNQRYYSGNALHPQRPDNSVIYRTTPELGQADNTPRQSTVISTEQLRQQQHQRQLLRETGVSPEQRMQDQRWQRPEPMRSQQHRSERKDQHQQRPQRDQH